MADSRYYEIISDDTFIGVGTSRNMICYQEKHNILLGCDEQDAQYIMYNENLYHASWMLPVHEKSPAYMDAQVIEIDETVYQALLSAIENGEEVDVTEDEEQEEESTEPSYGEGEEVTLEYIRSAKLTEISKTCNAAIVAGTDVETSSGVAHFNLTEQDQLNIGNLFNFILLGGTEYPYQSDGGVCTVYTATDIATIYITTQIYITGQTTYHNLLKQYVEGLETIEEIAAVTYGQELTGDYLTEYQEKMTLVQSQMNAIVASMMGGDEDEETD